MNSGSDNERPSTLQWQEWLARHGPALLLYARQQTRSMADAEDLLQEAVVESWRERSDDSPPPLWRVCATLRHRAIDLARSSQRRARREHASMDEVPEAWFDSTPEERERAALIQQSMSALTPMHREILALKIWAGLTFAEIGQALSIPPNTAASRYRNALGELRKLTREAFV